MVRASKRTMKKPLSILNSDQNVSLETTGTDRAMSALKIIAAAAPLGGTISEILANLVPDQKLDRVVEFVRILDFKIANAERKIEEAELKTAEFTDLLEDLSIRHLALCLTKGSNT